MGDRFLGITSTFGEYICLAQVHNTAPRVRIEPRPLAHESEALTTRPSRSPYIVLRESKLWLGLQSRKGIVCAKDRLRVI